MTPIHTQAPGKLVLFGEYAVLEGHTALVASVNRYARCRIEPHSSFELDAGQFGTFGAEDLSAAPPFAHVQLATQAHTPIKVSLDSKAFYVADRPNSEKLGLGSSAAVSVALSACLGLAHGQKVSPTTLFEKTHTLHRNIQGVGSGVDIAAACFGGVFSFRHTDDSVTPPIEPGNQVLNTGTGQANLSHLVPKFTSVLGVYLGHGASTPKLVKHVQALRTRDCTSYGHMMDQIGAVSTQAVQAWCAGDQKEIARCAKETASVLARLGRAASCDIIPPSMHRLEQQLSSLGAVGKTTGAGGGDMAWVICEDEAHQYRVAQVLEQDWQVYRLDIAKHGAKDVSNDFE